MWVKREILYTRAEQDKRQNNRYVLSSRSNREEQKGNDPEEICRIYILKNSRGKMGREYTKEKQRDIDLKGEVQND